MFTKEQIGRMEAHAREEYPRECVGAVIGDTVENGELIRLRNVQDEMARRDPGHFDRSARTGYFVDPREVLSLVNRARTEGKKILAFYHSHPDHDSYFSAEDHAGAVMFGEPVYPDAVYVVVSIYGGKVKRIGIFAWDGKTYSPSGELAVDNE